jgi:ADP-heptose:LPS heptosyltransferase
MNLIEQLTEKYLTEKSRIIDECLLEFLHENALANSSNVDEIRDELRKNDFEVIIDTKTTLSSEIYTFKICKVYKTKQLTIPNPTPININD